MRVTFKITKKMISAARKKINTNVGLTSTFCPTALAIKEEFGKDFDLYVGSQEVTLGRKLENGTHSFTDLKLPKAVQSFIFDFDSAQKVGELAFTLNVPKRFLPKQA